MESLSMVSHTNALIKNRETIDINLYEQFIKYLDASPNCNSEKGMSYTQYYNRFKNLTCALGMDHSPHETRHTFATLAKEAKVDEYCLKLILGHNIADLTERVYTHRKKEQLLEEIKKIE